jgi:gamma-glutamylcyclotransferase (GGCT)/AIG2-like uncharacterized protein YtfP
VSGTGGSVDQLFVYGTLRTGQRAHGLLAPHVRASEPAWCRGTMYGFATGYPGVVLAGSTRIVGEVVGLTDPAAAFVALDAYEGDEFARVVAEVEVMGGVRRAWIYVLSDPALTQLGSLIDSGDWAGCVVGQEPTK